jgi:hypothetical protein
MAGIRIERKEDSGYFSDKGFILSSEHPQSILITA